MKIVVISDIHSNFAAVQALRETWDELWVLGDLVNYGPRPAEVIDWVRDHAHVVIRGNHDHATGFSTDPRCSAPYRAMAAETARFTDSVLTDEHKRYLERLPLSATRRLGRTTFYLCHATVSDPLFGYRNEDAADWDDEVRSTEADVVLVGHTHIPFARDIGGQLLLNPGSIGQPKTNSPDACYALWEDGKFTIKSYRYPVGETEAQILEMPIVESVKRDLIFALGTGGQLRTSGG